MSWEMMRQMRMLMASFSTLPADLQAVCRDGSVATAKCPIVDQSDRLRFLSPIRSIQVIADVEPLA